MADDLKVVSALSADATFCARSRSASAAGTGSTVAACADLALSPWARAGVVEPMPSANRKATATADRCGFMMELLSAVKRTVGVRPIMSRKNARDKIEIGGLGRN